MAKAAKKTEAAEPGSQRAWPFGKKNYILFAISILVIVLGFFLLSTGDITLAPILLVAGYCVLLPVAIIVRDKPEAETEAVEPAETEA